MKLFCVFSFLFGFSALAKHEHRHHEAHEHGSAKVQVAFDQRIGKMTFNGAALPIVGFETAAKSTKQKAAVEEAYKKFDINVSKMFSFLPELNCQFSKQKMNFEKEKPTKGEKHSGEHSDFSATYGITCDKSPAGTRVTIDFSMYPELHDVDVDFLLDSVAKSVEFKGKPVQIELIK